MDTIETMTKIDSGAFDEAFGYLYSEKAQEQRARYKNAALQFETLFGAGREIRLFSAPGRTEVGGNHTDHQHGRVLAAGVNLDVIAVASKNDDRIIRIKSEGFPMDVVDLSDLSARDDERNTAAALIRGCRRRPRSKRSLERCLAACMRTVRSTPYRLRRLDSTPKTFILASRAV